MEESYNKAKEIRKMKEEEQNKAIVSFLPGGQIIGELGQLITAAALLGIFIQPSS
jgi:hypothetical protein